MGDNEERAPRMRDLGEQRQPITGVVDIGKVGDVGELPYHVDVDPGPSDRDLRPLLLAVVVLIAVVAIVVAATI